MKTCTKCKATKPAADFSTWMQDGRLRSATQCKPCKAAYRREYLAARPELKAAEHRRAVEGMRLAQADTAASAESNRLAWSEEEEVLLARDDLTIKDIAHKLGRSYAAVAGKRRQIKVGKVELSRTAYASQAETLEGASNNYKGWTGPEMELILRNDLTATETAQMLGRTVYAVRAMRRRCSIDPRVQVLAGERIEL